MQNVVVVIDATGVPTAYGPWGQDGQSLDAAAEYASTRQAEGVAAYVLEVQNTETELTERQKLPLTRAELAILRSYMIGLGDGLYSARLLGRGLLEQHPDLSITITPAGRARIAL